MMRLLAALLLLVPLVAARAAAQISDDAQFRAQQELRRLEAARENLRIEQERALSERDRSRATSPPGVGSVRGDPARNYDFAREQNRLRDEADRIERDTDRLRTEQRRYENERLFSTPPGSSPPAWRP